MTGHRLGCEDKNECDWQPCGLNGSCHNIDKGRGWWCECPSDFSCTNCTCDGDIIGSQRERSVVLSGYALAVILSCLFAYLSKIFYFVFRSIFCMF